MELAEKKVIDTQQKDLERILVSKDVEELLFETIELIESSE